MKIQWGGVQDFLDGGGVPHIGVPIYFYRSQQSCGKVMFSQASVSHSVHRGVSASVHVGIHPLGRYAPLGRYTPLAGMPPGQVHPPE